jgi:hypothetical protein
LEPIVDVDRMIVCQINELRVVVNPDKAIKLGSKASAIYCLVQRGVSSRPGCVIGLHPWWHLSISIQGMFS